MTFTPAGWVILATHLLVAPWLVAQGASPPRQAGQLQPQHVMERDLGPSQTDQYTVDVKAGQFVRLVARQMGVDVSVTILDPRGKTVAEMDRPNGTYGPEAVSFVGETTGKYRVRVTNGSATTGHYRMEFPDLRPPTEADRNRIVGEKVEMEANRESLKDTKEANLHSIELFERAGSIWRLVGDAYEQGLCLYAIAAATSSLGDQRKALHYYGQALPFFRAAGDRPGEASTLFDLGVVSDDLDEKQKALDYYGEALPVFRAVGDRLNEASTLNHIGLAYRALGEKQKALDSFQQALPLARAVGDRLTEAGSLKCLGQAYYDIGEKQKSLDSYQQSLVLFRALAHREGQAIALNNMGLIYSDQHEFEKSADSYNQALAVVRGLGNKQAEATTLDNLGALYLHQGEKQKALDTYSQALQLIHGRGDQAAEAGVLQELGTAYNSLGETQKALDSAQQALVLYRTTANRKGEATALNDIGQGYYLLGENQKALDYYGQAVPLFHAVADQSGEAEALDDMCLAYSALGEKQKALDYCGQALPMNRAAHDRAGEAATLSNLGTVYNDLGENQKALDYFGQALTLVRSAGNRSGEGTALNNIGLIYDHLGERHKSLDYFAQALALHRAAQDRLGEATTLNNTAGAYSAMGEEQKALEYLDQALSIVRRIGSRFGEATTLGNIGHIYLDLSEPQRALNYYGQALALHRATGSRPGEAIMLNNLGLAFYDLGEKQKALDYYGLAMPILRAVGDRSGQATTLNNIGFAYDALGERQKALDYYGQGLALARAIGDRPIEAATLNNIGMVYHALGEKQKALDNYGLALPIYRAVGDRSGAAATLGNLSLLFAKSQPDLAILLQKQAVNLLQTVRQDNRGLEDSVRKSFEKSFQGHYRQLAGLLVDRQRFGEAEEVLDLLKDKEAAEFVRRDAVSDQLKPATLLDSERQALDRYEEILTQIVSEGEAKAALVAKAAQAPLSSADADRDKQLDRDLSAANTVLLRFFTEEEKTFAANSAAAKRVGEMRESEGLQDTLQALGKDVVAIYTLVLPDKYTALLVTSGARKVYSTAIPEADLNRKIFVFRQQLQNPASNPLPLAQELYKILFPEGLRQDLDSMGAKTIMWSIDSTIRYVPIAALHDGQQYLVARFRNSLITPASLPRLTEELATVWKGVGFGVSQANGSFTALPGVPEELHRIFRQGADGNAPVAGRVELDGEFTRETFEAAMRQPEKSVVHIATHFDSQPGVAANSHLLLGDGTEMSLADIEAMPRLFSGVDLLTLSACSTAFTNRTEDGREVDSFGTIAQRLGAKGVIASLWSVSDEATARLMETMYRIRQNNPELGKSEALRQAQQQMATGVLKPADTTAADRGVSIKPAAGAPVAWTHPYYWAPFILIGNWK